MNSIPLRSEAYSPYLTTSEREFAATEGVEHLFPRGVFGQGRGSDDERSPWRFTLLTFVISWSLWGLIWATE
jgi:hypothetical protein